MLYNDRIDISEEIDLAKSNKSKKCMIWSVNISDSITFKNTDYRCIIYNISKSEAINLLRNCVLENHGYI